MVGRYLVWEREWRGCEYVFEREVAGTKMNAGEEREGLISPETGFTVVAIPDVCQFSISCLINSPHAGLVFRTVQVRDLPYPYR